MLYNVLVVEDDHRTAQSLAAMIGVLGHTVGIAYGPRMALKQLNEVIPDVIFLDWNMPGINGLEVLRFLRRDPYTRDVPVVLVSANDSEEEIQTAMKAGANYYIVKPPTVEEIEAVLGKIFPQKAQTKPSTEPVSPKAPPNGSGPAPKK